MSQQTSFALALSLLAFWLWRVVVAPSPIGLVLFATSAILPVAGLLLISAFTSEPEETPARSERR